MVGALHKKLVRDLWGLKGQIITIALVIASGIATYTSLQSCYRSLLLSKSAFYSEHRFADAFAVLERAPRALADELAQIDGVTKVYEHIVEAVTVPVESLAEPAMAHVVSLPEHGPPALNAVMLRAGRWPEPGRPDEVVLLQAFAESHQIRIGDTLPAILNERMQRFRVVGLGVSPEYIFPVQGGVVTPDEARFAVLWMGRDAAAAAFDLDGAFSAVAFRLEADASVDAIQAEIDTLLEPYGGVDAYLREDQPSNSRLEGEFLQLQAFATVVPSMFLAVAALLLNIVLARLVQLQRTQIATLKALGYRDPQIALHFVLLFSSTLLLGSVIGLLGGAWLGEAMTDLYLHYFRLPAARFVLETRVALTAVGISAAAGLFGALLGMRSVVRLVPAEAMRPAAPARYRRTLLDRTHWARRIAAPARMVLREVERRPFRTLLSSFAIACATAIVVTGRFSGDATEHILTTVFRMAWREDLHVEFHHPVPVTDLNVFRHYPGVREVEPMRWMGAEFEFDHREKVGLVVGYEAAELRRPFDDQAQLPRALPAHGALVSQQLGKVLGLELGDRLRVRALEEERPRFELPVAGFIDESFGLMVHVNMDQLDQRLGQEPRTNTVLLNVDGPQLASVQARIKELPLVRSVLRRASIIEQFEEQTAGMLNVTMWILSAFASCIVIGVVYNNARVALSMRARDLATMRVLGFRQGEVAAVLYGELAVQVLLALPLGLWIGQLLCQGVAATVDPDEFRLPVVLTVRTYLFASMITVLASFVAGLMVRQRLRALDLIGVLKTTE
ncbi:MAG: FtsX-like permease family protein [Myxococcota bacterium]